MFKYTLPLFTTQIAGYQDQIIDIEPKENKAIKKLKILLKKQKVIYIEHYEEDCIIITGLWENKCWLKNNLNLFNI